mmetsp:Transcript_9210/g.37772  ORF Transcript_9210/g.37772 Transcript_9210/m.37772 type:complete len:213 (+) Transcript_9210:1240-1878(+)
MGEFRVADRNWELSLDRSKFILFVGHPTHQHTIRPSVTISLEDIESPLKDPGERSRTPQKVISAKVCQHWQERHLLTSSCIAVGYRCDKSRYRGSFARVSGTGLLHLLRRISVNLYAAFGVGEPLQDGSRPESLRADRPDLHVLTRQVSLVKNSTNMAAKRSLRDPFELEYAASQCCNKLMSAVYKTSLGAAGQSMPSVLQSLELVSRLTPM